MAKALGEDQIGMEIVLDEGTFKQDLDKLAATAKKSTSVKVDADTSAARADIDKLKESVKDERFNVTADADTAAARAHVDEFVNNKRHINVVVDVDTTRAKAQLAAFRAEQAAIGAASGGLGSVFGAAGSAGNAGGGLSGFDPSKLLGIVGGGSGGLTTALGAAGPYGAAAAAITGVLQQFGQMVAMTGQIAAVGGAVGLIGTAASASALQVTSLAASIGQLGGLAALLPAVGTGVLGIAGTAATILNGIPDAVTAIQDAKKNAVPVNPEIEAIKAKRARETVVDAEKAAAKAQINAIDAVEAARKAAFDADTSAREAYASAQDAAAKAAKEEVNAQLALADARRIAGDQLESLRLQAERSTLNQEKANKALQVAKDNLAEASTNKRLMPEQLGAYRDAVKEAELTAKESAQRNKEIQAAFSKADQQQIDGADAVVAAKQRVEDATANAAKTAERAAKLYGEIETTRIEGEKRIAKVQIDSAESVEAANKRAHDASEDFYLRGLEEADKHARAVKDVEASLKRISPAARDAVAAVIGFMDQYNKQVGLPVQEEFFKGIADSLTSASDKLLPELETGMSKIAGGLSDSTKTWFDEIASSLDEGVLDRILSNLNTGLENANKGIGPLVDAFTTMGDTGSKYFPQMGDALADMSKKFSEFIDKSAKNGDLDRWIKGGLDGLEDIGTIALNVVKVIDEINKASSAADGLSLDSFAKGMEQFADWLADPSTQDTMKTLFEGGKVFFEKLGEALPAIGDMIKDNAPAFKQLADTFGEIGADILKDLATLLSDPKVVEGFQKFADGIQKGFEGIEPALPELGEFVGKFLEFLGSFSEESGEGIGKFIEQVGPLATNFLKGLIIVLPYINDFMGLLIGMKDINLQKIGDVVDTVTKGADGALKFITGGFSADWDKAWNDLVDVPGDVFGDFDLQKTLDDAFRNFGNFWNDLGKDFGDGFGDLIDGIVEDFRNGGKDAINAMKNGLGNFNLGSALDALNPLNVFHFGGAPAPLARSFSMEPMLMTANAPTVSDFKYNTRVNVPSPAAAGAGKYYNIENLTFSELNDLEEMMSAFFGRIDL